MPDGDAPGWLLGERYRVLDRLGTGGMAEVLRAHDETLDRDVAVKVFRALIEDPDDPAGEERRELELHSLARLNHPNLVTLYDGSVSDNPAYLVLELVDGPTLAQALREGPLTEADAALVGGQIASALAYVHANGMVHRDVKPANILLGTDGGPAPDAMRARLSDFGIVRLLDGSRMTAVGRTMGTATYLAPEQARGQDVGAPADVYSLGLVLIEALTGAPSFDGPLDEVIAARLSRPPEIPAALPQPWPGLLAAMTATDPAARPDAATVANTLRGTASSGILSSLPTAAVPVVPAGSATGPLAGAGTGAVAAAATGPLSGAAAGVPFVAPLPVGEENRATGRPKRSGMGLPLAIVALGVLLIGGLVVLLTAGGGGGTPGTTPGSSGSARHAPGQVGGSLAANTSGAHSAPHTHSASSSSAPSSVPQPSSAPQTSSPPSSSSPPSAPHSSRSITTTSSSRPPSSSSSVPRTSSSAVSSSRPAPARTSASASSAVSSSKPVGPRP